MNSAAASAILLDAANRTNGLARPVGYALTNSIFNNIIRDSAENSKENFENREYSFDESDRQIKKQPHRWQLLRRVITPYVHQVQLLQMKLYHKPYPLSILICKYRKCLILQRQGMAEIFFMT